MGDQTVPDALLGCWRRNWIRFGDSDSGLGDPDSRVTVIWLQTASGMGDLRIDPDQQPEETDSSCGITVVENTSPLVTADWQDGPTGFAQQAVSNFPEKGWLDWDSPTIMRELAPSGAYVEEWQKLPGSSGEITHLTAPDAPTLTNLYIAGRHYFLALQAAPSSAEIPLHQFSYGVRPDLEAPVSVQLSTVSEVVGTSMNLDFDWVTVSHMSTDGGPDRE